MKTNFKAFFLLLVGLHLVLTIWNGFNDNDGARIFFSLEYAIHSQDPLPEENIFGRMYSFGFYFLFFHIFYFLPIPFHIPFLNLLSSLSLIFSAYLLGKIFFHGKSDDDFFIVVSLILFLPAVFAMSLGSHPYNFALVVFLAGIIIVQKFPTAPGYFFSFIFLTASMTIRSDIVLLAPVALLGYGERLRGKIFRIAVIILSIIGFLGIQKGLLKIEGSRAAFSFFSKNIQLTKFVATFIQVTISIGFVFCIIFLFGILKNLRPYTEVVRNPLKGFLDQSELFAIPLLIIINLPMLLVGGPARHFFPTCAAAAFTIYWLSEKGFTLRLLIIFMVLNFFSNDLIGFGIRTIRKGGIYSTSYISRHMGGTPLSSPFFDFLAHFIRNQQYSRRRRNLFHALEENSKNMALVSDREFMHLLVPQLFERYPSVGLEKSDSKWEMALAGKMFWIFPTHTAVAAEKFRKDFERFLEVEPNIQTYICEINMRKDILTWVRNEHKWIRPLAGLSLGPGFPSNDWNLDRLHVKGANYFFQDSIPESSGKSDQFHQSRVEKVEASGGGGPVAGNS